MIKHIVLWRFKQEAEGLGKNDIMDKIHDDLFALRPVIPEILSMEIGKDVGVGRDTYDMVLIMTFSDAKALDTYQNHPAHKVVSAFVGKVRVERSCVDFIC